MRIIKFKYRHTERAHWEGKEWTKERNGKIKEQMRVEKNERLSSREEKKDGRRKAGVSHLTPSHNCGVEAMGREK